MGRRIGTLDEFMASDTDPVAATTPSPKQAKERRAAGGRVMPLADAEAHREVTLRGEDVTFEPVEPIQQTDQDFSFFPGLTEREINDAKAAGPRGMFETFLTQPSNMIPMKDLPVLNAMNALLADIEDPDLRINRGLQRPGAEEALRKSRLFRNASPEKRRRLLMSDEQLERETDIAIVSEFYKQLELDRIRGVTLGGKIAEGAQKLPAFAVAFAASGGLAAMGKGVVSKAAAAQLSAAGGRMFIGQRSLVTAAEVTGSAVAAFPIAGSPTLLDTLTTKGVFDRLKFTDKGAVLVDSMEKEPYKAFFVALADTFVEVWTERVGGVIPGLPTPSFVKKWIPLRNTLRKLHKTSKLFKRTRQGFDAAGIQNIFTEFGEEILAAVVQGVFGLKDVELAHPDAKTRSARLLDTLVSSLPNAEEAMVIAGVLAFPGAARASIPSALGVLERARSRTEPLSDRPLKELSTEEVQAIVAPESQEVGDAPQKEKKVSTKKPLAVERKVPEVEKKAEAETLAPGEIVAIEGRIERLEEERQTLFDEINPLSAEADRLAAKSPPLSTAAVDAKIAARDRRIDKIEAEIQELRSTPGAFPKATSKITSTPRRVLAAVKKQVAEAVKLTKAQIKQIQGNLIKAIAERLPPEDRAKFAATVKNIQTQEQLQKALPKIEARVEALEAKRLKSKTLGKIKKLLKRTKPKSVSGRPKGKFRGDVGAEIQKALDLLRKASKLSALEAFQRAQQINEDAKGRPLSEEELLELASLEAAGLGDKSPEELARFLDRLEQLVETGKAETFAIQLAEAQELEKTLERVVNTLQGSRPVTKTDKPTRGVKKFIRDVLSTAGKSISGWLDLNNIMSRDDKTSKSFESALSKFADTTEIEQKEKGDAMRRGQRLLNAGLEIFGFTKERQFLRQLRRDAVSQEVGTYQDAAGDDVRLEISRAQARKLWMEIQDPDVKASIMDKNGGYVIDGVEIDGMTQEMLDAIFTNTDLFDTADLNFARAQMELYQEFYNEINAQFRKDRGVDLPHNPVYSPLRRQLKKKNVVESFFDEMGFRNSINPKFTKSRVKNFHKVVAQSDVEVYQRHIAEMGHYLNWADKLRAFNQVYGNATVRNIIERKFGKGTMSLVDQFIERFTNGGLARAQDHVGWVNMFRVNFTTAQLALKPALTLKQMVSHIAFAETIPTHKYVSGFLDFWRNPIKNAKILMEADFLKTRATSITRDIRDASHRDELSLLRQSPSWRNMLLFTTRLGDQGAIITGGWAVYKHHRDTGKTHDEALREFVRVANSTQQSSDLSQLSKWQNAHSLGKLFTMFTSSQNQYFRREIAAWRGVFTGRVNFPEFAKKIAIYHFILPMFFQWVSDFGRWDEDEQKRAALLGSLNGMFILGDFLDYTIRTGMNQLADADLAEFGADVPVFDIERGIKKAFREIDPDDILFEDVLKAVGELASGTLGPASGLPAKRIFDSFEGVSDISEGDTERGVLKLMGWSPWLVDKTLDKEDE